MKKALIIVESPAKAKKIQEFLGSDYIVLASFGHITDLAKKGPYNLGIEINNNFKQRYVLMDDKVEVLSRIIEAAKQSKLILLNSDADREGESISWQLYTRLVDLNIPIKRITTKEITKKAVLEALKNPRDIDLNLSNAQVARRCLDRIVGFMSSPFLMNYHGNNLSAGRVQSVATRLIIDREREIEAFIPEEYWVIKASLSKDNQLGFSAKYDPKVSNEADAKRIKADLIDPAATYVVSSVISSSEKKNPPAPMITSELQRVMSKSFGFSAERTMTACQSLYENSYISYHRTDSVRLEPEAIKEIKSWLSDNGYQAAKTNIHKNKDAAQDAHTAISPTYLSLLPDNPEIILPDEKKVYEIIWKYFIASQMEPAVYDTLKVSLHLASNKKHILKASGKALKSKGFLEILGVTDNSKIDIPSLTKGDQLNLFGKNPVTAEKKFTQPPARFTEDTLIKTLVSKKIGRPATFAEILSKITHRNYVEKRGNSYYATELGKKITDVLTNFFTFMEYNYTSELEKKLDLVEHGKIDYVQLLKEFYIPFKKELDSAYQSFGIPPCEKCQNPMIYRTNKAGEKFLGCLNYPDCRGIRNLASANLNISA